ncbi:P27 family phage terminase small subunit [Gulosibacter sediminis]|uniref:P27 family phage terminase small subunit n=1 Tax=Gulosibacter sediminis TaxID=1729695 RepID=UPI0024A835B5|nr:P27 family phage terminase small subunit [Gulosibacter sediminis]
MTKPKTPAGLRGRGGRLWRDLHADLEFDVHETELVLELCRTVNRIDELQATIDEHGTMVAGSTGQLIVNPAIAEQRQQQATLARLVTLLNLPSEDAGQQAQMISLQAKRAAEARWAKSKAVRGG